MRQFCFIILLFATSVIVCQENHFSQFYNSPQYVNPAFAGDAAYMRAVVSSRIMNPIKGSSPVVNSLANYDIKLIDHRSGLGLIVYHHTEVFSHTKIQLNYSSTFQLNKSAWVKGGLGISFNQGNSNALSLKYPDQYNDLGYAGISTSEPALRDKSTFAAIAAGFILYNEYLWFSLSGDYLNRPKENYAGTKTVNPVKICGSFGFLYSFDKDKTAKRRFSKFGGLEPYSSIGPVVNYVQQGKYTEVSGGAAFIFQPVYGGIHYRFQHDFRLRDADYAYKAIVLLVGYRQEEFSIAYSYDISLSNYSVNRYGAHEVSVVFYFSQAKEDHKRYALVPLISQLLY